MLALYKYIFYIVINPRTYTQTYTPTMVHGVRVCVCVCLGGGGGVCCNLSPGFLRLFIRKIRKLQIIFARVVKYDTIKHFAAIGCVL